jgi:hypothetical protein
MSIEVHAESQSALLSNPASDPLRCAVLAIHDDAVDAAGMVRGVPG